MAWNRKWPNWRTSQRNREEGQGFRVYKEESVMNIHYKDRKQDSYSWSSDMESFAWNSCLFSWRMILLKLKCVFEHTPSCLLHKATLVACSIALMVFAEGYEGQRIDWCVTFWSRSVYTVYLVQLCCFAHCGGCIPCLLFTIEALISSYFDELSMPDRLDTLRKKFKKWKSW